MSLFIRLWIMGTAVALAAGASAIGAYIFVTEQQRQAHMSHEASSIGRLIGHAMSLELFNRADGSDPHALLESRARQFMASGRILSLTVVDPDLEAVIKETPPGLEEEEASNELELEAFAAAFRQPINTLYRVNNAFYLLTPMIDEFGTIRFILAIGLPAQILEFPDESRTLFISLAVPLSLILGLIAAWVLTGQVGRPIRLLTTAADRLESGHFDTSSLTPLIDRRDEIGRLARTVLRLVQALDHLGATMNSRAETDGSRSTGEEQEAEPKASASTRSSPPGTD